jgi:hypothetical protein
VTSPTEVVLGLSGTGWTVVAAIAQALAALGAIALLIVTHIGRKDARDAIASARALVASTESLVSVNKAQQHQAVMPVIEIVNEAHLRRLRLTNRGNGPLVAPRLSLGSEGVELVMKGRYDDTYLQVGALAVGDDAYALVESGSALGGELVIEGITLSGAVFAASVHCLSVGELAAVVAKST